MIMLYNNLDFTNNEIKDILGKINYHIYHKACNKKSKSPSKKRIDKVKVLARLYGIEEYERWVQGYWSNGVYIKGHYKLKTPRELQREANIK